MAASRLIALLADGGFHSGESLAGTLGVSRTAVWKRIQRLSALWGLEIEAVRGKGYRLARPLDLLDEAVLLRALGPEARRRIAGLEIHADLDSTNSHLMTRALAGDRGPRVCLAERQGAGRGRLGRHWLSPYAANLYLSILWQSPRAPHQLGGLSIAMGVVVAQLLREIGFGAVGLKWPNDLITEQGKLGGLLMQLHGEGEGPSTLVIGLGLNVAMPKAIGQRIDQPWTDLRALGQPPARSLLAAWIINRMFYGLLQYDAKGLEPFVDGWRQLDLLRDRPLVLIRGNERLLGNNGGIASDGALILKTAQGIRHFHSGEVSLRGQ